MKLPWVIARTSIGIGDNLLLSAVARELHVNKLSAYTIVLTAYPELLLNNPYINYIIKAKGKKVEALLSCRLPMISNLIPFVNYSYLKYEPTPFFGHPIKIMCERTHPALSNPNIKVDIFLNERERKWARNVLGEKPSIAIHSCGATYWTPNKEWFNDRFQSVTHELRKKYQVIQLGVASNPRLEGALDFRGKTSLRETASLLGKCKMAIFQEGFLSHLANAVKIPAVVILGGWQPKSICYPDQIGLSGETECAPCFRLKPCLIEKKCMKKIGVDEVLGAVSIIERRIS